MQADQTKLAESAKAAVSGAIVIYGMTGVWQVMAGDNGFVFAIALSAATYFFVYRNLTANLATAKVAAMLFALVAVFFIFVNIMLINMTYGYAALLALPNIAVAACLGYAFEQLRRLENSGPQVAVVAPSSAAAGKVPDDVMEQLKKLGELHSAGVLTDAEFEVKKSELLKRV